MKTVTIPNVNKEDLTNIKKVKLDKASVNEIVKTKDKVTLSDSNVNGIPSKPEKLIPVNVDEKVGDKPKLESMNVNAKPVTIDKPILPNVNDPIITTKIGPLGNIDNESITKVTVTSSSLGNVNKSI